MARIKETAPMLALVLAFGVLTLGFLSGVWHQDIVFAQTNSNSRQFTSVNDFGHHIDLLPLIPCDIDIAQSNAVNQFRNGCAFEQLGMVRE